MEKKNKTLVSNIWLLFICAVVISTLVLGVTAVSFAAKKATETAGALIDINSADQKALESLPGIGKSTAKAIIAGRPFNSIDDLKRVKGMTDKKIQAIRDKVTVGGAVASAPPAAAPQKASPASPAQKPTSDKPSKATSKLAPGQRININTATQQEIEALPAIGPAKAKAIIAGRPYTKIEDIMKVKGIKQKIFDKIKDNITVK
jgi:competence protein ComEA